MVSPMKINCDKCGQEDINQYHICSSLSIARFEGIDESKPYVPTIDGLGLELDKYKTALSVCAELRAKSDEELKQVNGDLEEAWNTYQSLGEDMANACEEREAWINDALLILGTMKSDGINTSAYYNLEWIQRGRMFLKRGLE